MSRASQHRIAQLFLFLVWLGILATEITQPVESQTCGNRPQFYNPTFPPPKSYWTPDTSVVVVKMDAFFESMQVGAINGIIEGNEKWNNPLTCSLVRFKDFETVFFTEDEYVDPPPMHHVYWQVGGHTNSVFDTQGPTACDFAKVRELYCPSPSPTPSPTPEPSPWYWPLPLPPIEPGPCQSAGWFWNFRDNTCNQEESAAHCPHYCIPYLPLDAGGCLEPVDYCAVVYGCPPGAVDGGAGCCCFPTPILIDINGNGFSLTDAYSGVMFDMGGDGRTEPIAWTSSNTDDAWLAYDRNGNGRIESGKELFGNFTEQPHATTTRNGFLALAEFDLSTNGGNGDGVISKDDAVFSSLLLWQDVNKNGISETSELHALKEFGIKTLELDFKESKQTDAFGNKFRYRAKVKDDNNAQLGRWAWDVILQANPPQRP